MKHIHEKILFLVSLLLFYGIGLYCLFCGGCSSVTKVLYNGTSASEVRDGIAELQNEQSEIAVTSERIAGASEEITDGLGDIRRTVEERATDDDEFKRILEQVRTQELPERSGENPTGP